MRSRLDFPVSGRAGPHKRYNALMAEPYADIASISLQRVVVDSAAATQPYLAHRTTTCRGLLPVQIALAGAVLMGGGCSTSSSPPASLAVERLSAAKEDSIHTECTCMAEVGEAPSVDACLADRIAVVSASGYRLACLAELPEDLDQEGLASLSCLADAEEAWAACMGAIPCTERTQLGDAASAECTAALRSAALACDLSDPRLRACQG